MGTFVVVFIVMVLFILIMSVGVLMGRKPISGSCGGMKALGMDVACDICGGDEDRCKKEKQKAANTGHSSDLSYDATTNRKPGA
ncbi:MAG: ApbE family protein [Proteobacteria bacterium]|nr:MAG: ApbE family protein [Pseudomonadota bacterium]